MSENKSHSHDKKSPRKRDMLVFCERLEEEMSGLPVLEQARLVNDRLDELSPEELDEYFDLTDAGSDRNFYVGISS